MVGALLGSPMVSVSGCVWSRSLAVGEGLLVGGVFTQDVLLIWSALVEDVLLLVYVRFFQDAYLAEQVLGVWSILGLLVAEDLVQDRLVLALQGAGLSPLADVPVGRVSGFV
jgi:hypothetical protein